MKRVQSGAAGVIATVAVIVLAPVAPAQEVEVSGNVAILSDYAFRGVSQTSEEPAIQGGLDLSLPAGLYLGAWGSNVNFGEPTPRAQMELDVYGGIAPSMGGMDLDLGLIYYAYPGADSENNFDYLEVMAALSRAIGPVTAGLTGAYSPDFFGASGAGLFGAFELGVAIPDAPIGLDGGIGYQSIEDNDAFELPNYMVWSGGVSADIYGSTLSLMLTGTDLSDDECGDICSARLIVGVSRQF